MTDDEIKIFYRRVKAFTEADYDTVIRIISDLSSIPYDRVFEVCLDED